MTVRKCLMGAAMAALVSGSAAFAADQSSAPAAAAEQSPSVYYMDASGPTSLTPFMYWMSGNSVGKWMIDNHMSINGFVEGGYFYDANNPRFGTSATTGNNPTDVAFPGAYSNRGLLDQADLMIQKTVDTSKSQWDWGFQFEQNYGADDLFIHSYGVLDNRGLPSTYNNFRPNQHAGSPENQYDIIQANVSVLIPVGSGLTIKVGKFVTLLSEEVINPTGNAFFSHSYNFAFGVPATQTGILGSYTFGKAINGQDLTITAGITRGWNESSRDNNGAIDFLGQAAGKWNDKLSWALNVSEGPEANKDDRDYWTVLEFLPTYAFSDQLSATLDLLWGDAPGFSTTNPGHAAQWYSTAGYVSYKWNANFTFNFRGEWYRDQGGSTVGNAQAFQPAGSPFPTAISANYYAATVGASIKPWPTNDILQWLVFRPEVRYDWSDRPSFNHAHSGSITGVGDYNQLSFAMDAIMQF